VQGAAGGRLVARPLAGDHDVDAVIAENALQLDDVGETRHIFEDQRVRGQQTGDHQGQRGVLGARDRDRAIEPLSADDAYPVHSRPAPRSRSRPRPIEIEIQAVLWTAGCLPAKHNMPKGYHPRPANTAKVGPGETGKSAIFPVWRRRRGLWLISGLGFGFDLRLPAALFCAAGAFLRLAPAQIFP
jgi:hypothetical protein